MDGHEKEPMIDGQREPLEMDADHVPRKSVTIEEHNEIENSVETGFYMYE